MLSEKRKLVAVLGYIVLILILGITLGIAISNVRTDERDCSLAIPIFYGEDVSDESCRLWVIDDYGNGFATETDYCIQLKNNCETTSHNLRCTWDNDLNGCSCKGKDNKWKCIAKEKREG